MKRQKLVALLILAASFMGSAGCRVEGFRNGVNEGVTAALSALISTPVVHALNQSFPEE